MDRKEYSKKYYEDNLDKIKEVAKNRLSKDVKCELCDCMLKQSSYYFHKKSKKHKQKQSEKEKKDLDIEKKILNTLRKLIDY
jgi:hypothetical protein